MFSSSSTSRTFALSAALLAAAANALTVNTPAALIQCQPVQLSWGEGTAPYYVSIIPGGQPSAVALETFDTQTSTTYTWMVDIAAGQSVTVKIVDFTGETNYSDQVTVQAGSDASCSSSSSGSAAAAGSTTSAAATESSSSAKVSVSRTALSGNSSSSSKFSFSKTSSGTQSATNGVANAASSPSASTTGAASSVKAALGLLVGGLVMALAA